jgi:hypothetical protein
VNTRHLIAQTLTVIAIVLAVALVLALLFGVIVIAGARG